MGFCTHAFMHTAFLWSSMLTFLLHKCYLWRLFFSFPVLQDITSLLHTIYEVVDASVNHSPSSSKTLRVKLSVAPDSSQRWRSCTQSAAGKACISTVGGSGNTEKGILGSSLQLPTVSTPREVFVVMQKGICFRPVRALFLKVFASLHLSHSIGFNFNDGGVTELWEDPPSHSAFKNSQRTLKRCAESFW